MKRYGVSIFNVIFELYKLHHYEILLVFQQYLHHQLWMGVQAIRTHHLFQWKMYGLTSHQEPKCDILFYLVRILYPPLRMLGFLGSLQVRTW
ncbi:hypothetical protein LFZ20_01625 [Salmonella enterica subsp. enterica serovar Johannesburg str. SA20025782]|nr:hypothetical protein LFZ20_01625 [Salmonella enterica subsp. enterica serovar Johannesburg str. SA20025782]